SRAVVAVEVFVEEDQVTPVRIVLELTSPAIDRPPSVLIAEESTRQPARDFLRGAEQRHVLAGTGGTLDLKFIAVELIQIQQRPNDQPVNWHPDGTSPV